MSNLPEEKAKPKRVKKAAAKKRSSPPPPKPDAVDVFIASEAEVCPYDENLLERARTQWQFGDWESLAQLNRDTLQHHPDRAKLALLAAAGHLQLGDTSAARQFTRLAQEWGCNGKLISQILIAGVHNSLARAAATSGQGTRALKHFESAIVTGTPGGDVRLLMQARIGEQFSQMGLPVPVTLHQALAVHAGSPLQPQLNIMAKHCNPPLEIQQIAIHHLGDAWAANSINTVIFRHHGILTSGQWQFTSFYVDENTLRFVQRNLSADVVEMFDLPGDYNLRDAHNSISLGIDRSGFLHVCYDHHGTRLRYRRSRSPHNIHGWTDELPMTGAHEESVTYPSFILPFQGQGESASNAPLMLLYRDGNWKKGSARLKSYDEGNESWLDHPTPILSGAEQRPWTSNAYWNHPVTGSDGSLHLSFVWRTDSIGEEERINNINVCYARSLDNGLTWHTSHNRPYQLPITQVNAETVHPVSPGCNLINQTSMALDSQNRPHIVFYSDDPDSIPQYQHLRFDGKRWHHQFISQRTKAFNLMGGGTLQIPISRPEIVIDRADNAYVIYRGDLTGNRMAITRLPAPDYAFFTENTQIACCDALGYAEPIIDRDRWARDNILTMLLQHNRQPDGDRTHDHLMTPVTLLDLRLK